MNFNKISASPYTSAFGLPLFEAAEKKRIKYMSNFKIQ